MFRTLDFLGLLLAGVGMISASVVAAQTSGASPLSEKEATVDIARLVRAKVPWTWLIEDPGKAAEVLTADDMAQAGMMTQLARVARRRGYQRDPRFVRLRHAFDDAALAELARLNVEKSITITDADRQAYFVAHPHRYDQFRLRHIFIGLHGTRSAKDRTEAEADALARELAARLQRGEDFETLAQRYSDDTATAALGGKLSILMGAFLAKPFFAAIADAKPGSVSIPVRGDEGFHIIRIDDRIGATARNSSYYIDQDILKDRLPDAIRLAISASY